MKNLNSLFDAVVQSSRESEDNLMQMLLGNINDSFGGIELSGIAVTGLLMQERRLAMLESPDAAPAAKALLVEERERYAAQRKNLQDALGSRFAAVYAKSRAEDAEARRFNKMPLLPEFNEDGTVK